MSTIFNVGDFVKPLRSLKHKHSFWIDGFGHGKKYKVTDFDVLDGEKILVLETGPSDIDYQLVYQDEVK